MTQEQELSDEDRQLVESISDELEQDPPLKCAVSFTWSGGSEAYAHEVLLFMRVQAVMLRRQYPELDFTALKQVTFHDDYELALREAQARVGRDLTPTREPGGFSYAMVVHALDHCELIANSRLAWGLLSADVEERDFHISVLRHELGHVADCARHRKVWADEWLSARMLGLRHHFYPVAHSNWSEYFANRVSDGPLAEDWLAQEEEMLADALSDAQTAIEMQKFKYRFSHDLEALRSLAERKLTFIAMVAGYVLGRHSARGLASPVTDRLREELRRVNWEDSFAWMREELERLYADRSNWRSTACMLPLESFWLERMAGFGLHYEDRGEAGVYIRVP